MLIFILYVIFHYIVQLIYLLRLLRLSYFISLTVTREEGILILITASDINARVTTLLGCLGFDLIDFMV